MRFLRFVLPASVVLLLLPGCYTSQGARDRAAIRAVQGKDSLVREAAAQAIAYAYPNAASFRVDTIHSDRLQEAISHAQLPSLVTVTFSVSTPNYTDGEIDSTVVFAERSLLHGVREIIYDFSARERVLPAVNASATGHVFQQTGPRTYFRRRPLPMM